VGTDEIAEGSMSVDYSMLPEHMQDGARRYIERGIEPGGFMLAVLENDLTGAAARADNVNRHCLLIWAEWLYNECPAPAWHSRKNVDAWIARGGTRGTLPRTPQQEQELEIMKSRGDL
jgi:hypothetical protein